MANDDGIDDGNILDLAGLLGVALGEEERDREWGAAVFEDGIVEDAQTGRVLDVVAGVAEPCRADLVVVAAGGSREAIGEEFGLDDVDGRRESLR